MSPKLLRFTTFTLPAFCQRTCASPFGVHICPRQVELKSHGLVTCVQERVCALHDPYLHSSRRLCQAQQKVTFGSSATFQEMPSDPCRLRSPKALLSRPLDLFQVHHQEWLPSRLHLQPQHRPQPLFGQQLPLWEACFCLPRMSMPLGQEASPSLTGRASIRVPLRACVLPIKSAQCTPCHR